MTLGNLVALKQTQIVRLLAYSGIAQAGYILLPFALVSGDAAANRSGFAACRRLHPDLRVMNLGAFAVAIAVSRRAAGAADHATSPGSSGGRRCSPSG